MLKPILKKIAAITGATIAILEAIELLDGAIKDLLDIVRGESAPLSSETTAGEAS